MPRSHIHGSLRRFHYGSNPTDEPGNDNFRSPIRMHNASTTTYDYGCNTEIYGLIRIATDDAGSYLWLILRQIRECVTWALISYHYQNNCIYVKIQRSIIIRGTQIITNKRKIHLSDKIIHFSMQFSAVLNIFIVKT